jgi:hypothetical protein
MITSVKCSAVFHLRVVAMLAEIFKSEVGSRRTADGRNNLCGQAYCLAQNAHRS